MIWLAIHMWTLLLGVFLLGLFTGWWMFSRHDQADSTDSDSLDRAAELQDRFQEPGNKDRSKDAPARRQRPETPVPGAGASAVSAQNPPLPEPRKPYLYEEPTDGPPDELQRISGIGPRYEAMLNELGIYYFAQIVGWSAAQILWLDTRLGFPGRITRDRWQEQARLLMLGASVGPQRHRPGSNGQAGEDGATGPGETSGRPEKA